MEFEEFKKRSIEATVNVLGNDAPKNWDFLTEELFQQEEFDVEESLLEKDSSGYIYEYGHYAYLSPADNKWHYARNFGSFRQKWSCIAKKVGRCHLQRTLYKFSNHK